MNLLDAGATFRMHSRQLALYRRELDTDSMREILDCIFAGSDMPSQYIELFKMVCDLEFVESAGSAMVNQYYALEARSLTVKLPEEIDFDCEYENGEYSRDDVPWLRGRVAGFNEAIAKVKRAAAGTMAEER